MSTQTHTPGPWVAVPQSDGSAMIAHEFETGKQMNPKGLRLIAHVLARRNSLAEDEANARLIAAAPELYASLRATLALIRKAQDRLCSYLEPEGSDDLAELTNDLLGMFDGPEQRAIEKPARAAIAKAEGRTP